MKILIYGGEGFIGKNVIKYLSNKENIIIKSKFRVENFANIENEIINNNPDRLICCIGRVKGKLIKNQTYLQNIDTLYENINDNLYCPFILAFLSNKYNIHLTYFGTSAFYNNENIDKKFNEKDIHNFHNSNYSIVKSFTDNIMDIFSNNVLNLRISHPITDVNDPNNLIIKLLNYKKITNNEISMTSIPHLFIYLNEMLLNNITGTFNFVNPGFIGNKNILEIYQKEKNTNLEYLIISNDPNQNKIRSCNKLDTTKIEKLYPNLKNINYCVTDCIKKIINS